MKPIDAISEWRTTEPQGAWMSFRKDNREYEAWLATQCDVVKKDIREKHHQMEKSAFIFLRATYFRWAKKIPTLCPELMDAPQLLSIGDLHLENFGTWRDADGRLVWGVNDFDEAAIMPYPLDLVRLAASIRLADLPVSNQAATAALLRGYREGLAQPQPALLDEGETWLRPYAADTEEKSRKFWKKVDGYSTAKPPRKITAPLIASLPKDAENIRFRSRVAGIGSLGRPRYVAVAFWRGGRILREAKALVPSAWIWAMAENPGRRTSWHWRMENTGRRIRFSMYMTNSSSGASPPIPTKSSWSTPAARSGSMFCGPWDSTSDRSMRRVRPASARCGPISRSGRAAG